MELLAKILIVDDEPYNVDYLEQELEDSGYRTVSAANGKEALEKALTEAPDLILLDVMMPGLDGFSVCRILKDAEETQLIPVVMMTALDAQADRIKGIEAGADDFLTKPVDRQEMLARIQTAVKMKRAVDRKIRGTRSEEAGRKESQPTGEALHKDSAPSAAVDNVFCREGEYWTIAYEGTVFRIKDMIGLRCIAHLLQYPHRQVHVLDLLAAIEGQPESSLAGFAEQTHTAALAAENLTMQARLGDAGEMLDPQALIAYKKRLNDLRAELDEAQSYNDPGRIEKIQHEIEFLTRELRGGVGLGGRARRAASASERARINVTRAIKSALQKLSSHHPDLGAYLTNTIHTGTSCSYTPDIEIPSPWQL